MKLDGHAKLTNSAIRVFKSNCSQATDIFFREKICQLPQFNTMNIVWDDWHNSNEVDNNALVQLIIAQELSLFSESLHKLSNGYLTREVVAVDLEPLKLRHHLFDSGQKYHYMRRASGASIRSAHKENVEFIRSEATNWIRLINHILYTYKRRGRSGGSTNFLRKKAVSHLALALHSLQDSFSPGHTMRVKYNHHQKPGAIEDIFIYNAQDKHKHSESDYASGSMHSLHARSAVYASAELMRLCALSVSTKSTFPVGWNAFQQQWLQLSAKAR